MSLSIRLKMVAEMVRRGSAVADIGTDHGYLPAYLVKSGRCPSAVASDLRKSPLENAKETIRIYGVENEVSLRLSDGLDSISPNEADDIILAGMGGTLIAQLLERAEWLMDSKKRIIVQPMTHSENVREFFISNGFEIISENACCDDGRDYICMCAQYTGKKSDKDDLYYYIGSHPIDGNAPSERYVKRQLSRLNKRASALNDAGVKQDEAAQLQKIINSAKEKGLWQK